MEGILNLYKKVQRLKDYISKLESVCIAFSGGVDSSFLTKIAYDILKDNAIAITVNSSMFPKRELTQSMELAKEIGIRHIIIDANEYEIKGFLENTKDRCYLCKYSIFKKIKEVAFNYKIKYIADGSILDDETDYRPGMKALEELKVLSPLKEMKLSKTEIRHLSKEIKLPTWDMPSFACLASRIPYGQVISPEKLQMIDQSEEFLMQLGFSQFRVRHHGDIARIELLPNEIKRIFEKDISYKIARKFKEIGFVYVSIDIEGYRTGSLNEKLYIKTTEGSD